MNTMNSSNTDITAIKNIYASMRLTSPKKLLDREVQLYQYLTASKDNDEEQLILLSHNEKRLTELVNKKDLTLERLYAFYSLACLFILVGGIGLISYIGAYQNKLSCLSARVDNIESTNLTSR